jgi:hypothetical protein
MPLNLRRKTKKAAKQISLLKFCITGHHKKVHLLVKNISINTKDNSIPRRKCRSEFKVYANCHENNVN